MIKFIVVEDNKMYSEKINRLILNKMMKNDYSFDILNYYDFDDELKNTIENREDNYIYILDFELPSGNAIDIARYIRQNDWLSPIIINSVYSGVAFESFKQRLELLDFVPKQIDSEKNINDLIDICLKKLNISKYLQIKCGGIDYNIDFNNILYFYKENTTRKTIIVTTNHKYEVYYNLCDIKLKLDKRFVQTHRACIVNKTKVEFFNWKHKYFELYNGNKVYLLSKSHKEEIENNDW